MNKRMDLTGKAFGKLIVTDFSHVKKSHLYWKCTCACGKETIISADHLRSGHTSTCGSCNHQKYIDWSTKQPVKHGMSGTSTYVAWSSMIQRCYDQKFAQYGDYGERGIVVCDRWKDFECFLEDMGYKPEGLTLERIDNSKGYCKDNCRWATRKEQANNRRTNMFITYKGITKTLAQWVDELGLNYDRVKQRIYRGWPIEKAFS